MNNFKIRTLTALSLTTIVMIMTNLGIYTFIALLAFINIGAMLEFYRLVALNHVARILGILFGTSLVLSIALVLNGVMNWQVLLIHSFFAFAIFLNELYAQHPRPFKNLSYTFMALIYITLPVCIFIALSFLPYGHGYNPQLVTGCFLIIWSSDTGAYITGKSFGRNLLFERISPHKTWEGSIGGLLSAALTAAILSYFLPFLSIQTWLMLSLITVVAGTFGDFFKSLLKRSLHIKDTGHMLPGHGGMLDRFDSFLGSAPFLFTYLIAYGHF